MKTLFVVDRLGQWKTGDAQIVAADDYLSGHEHTLGNYDRVINLCSVERYQGKGFYVSLVAEARGHRPVPTIKTIEDLHSAALPRVIEPELAGLVGDAFANELAQRVELDVYFGRDAGGRNSELAKRLFELLHAPLLRATFERTGDAWRLTALRAIKLGELPDNALSLLCEAVEAHYTRSGQARTPRRAGERPAIALLYEGRQSDSPSNAGAVQKFVEAGAAMDVTVEVVDRGVADRLDSFDGLFLRETTHLNHYTYDLARQASTLGLVVIDDPDSILQCNNKVYLHELLARHNVPMPKSVTIHRRNVDQIIPVVGLPCVLKQPDGAFSLGVSKVETADDLRAAVNRLLKKSELIIAQSFLPTAFDWRIGMLDRRPLFVCRYFMAPNHWQVIKRDSGGRTEGRTAAIPIGETPSNVLATAMRAANLIGAGFYGVDLKENGTGCFVMEVNDNPNVDAGNEDGIMGDALYREVIAVMKRRVLESSLRLPADQPAPSA